MRILKVSLVYFGIVFGVGFLFGMIRVQFVVPALGERTAEMIELPLMIAAVFFTARWVVHRFGLSSFAMALAIGILSALFLLLFEFSLVLWLRGITIGEYLSGRDPVAAVLYYIAVGIFALMLGLLALFNRSRSHE
jgi:hypothetical protein